MTHSAPHPSPPSDMLHAEARFRYSWRFVRCPMPDNRNNLEQVPLTLEDVLHPEVGDFIVHDDRHETDRMRLTAVLRACLENSGAAIVRTDVRIVWDIPDLRPNGPDVTAVRRRSPHVITTRAHDLGRKVEHSGGQG